MLASPRPLTTSDHYPSLTAFVMPTSTTTRTPSQKGLKGLFSRRSITSPEPGPASRLAGASKRGSGAEAGPVKSQLEDKKAGRGPSERNIRFASPDLPLARRSDDDGRWQPPSLSKGSISTPVLALLQDDHETPRAKDDAGNATKGKKGGHKHSLSLLFQAAKSGLRVQDPNATPKVKPSDGLTIRPPPPRTINWKADSQPPTPTPISPGSIEPLSQTPPRPSVTTRSVTSPVNSPTAKAPPTIRHFSDSKQSSLKSPSHGIPQAPGDTALSKEHYLLRLSTSYIVKTLLPLMRHETSSETVSGALKERERKVADERLRALARMEKNWGSDWVRAAGLLATSEKPLDKTDGGSGPLELKARSIHVGDRAKDRERRAWVEAMRDGVLLCIMINHLFPRQSPVVSRINLSEDGITRATNVSRFVTACEQVGLGSPDLCSPEDIQEGSEASLGKVGQTIIALARLAGPQAGRSSRPPTRPPSRNSGFTTPVASPPASPRAAGFGRDSSNFSSLSITPVQTSPRGTAARSAVPASGTRSPPPRIALRPRHTAPASRYSSETAGSSYLQSSESDNISLQPRPILTRYNDASQRPYTPSLVSSASRPTSANTVNRSSTTPSDSTSPYLFTPVIDAVEDDDDLDPEYQQSVTRERRMSERTLQMARHKIFTAMLQSTEDLDTVQITSLQASDQPRSAAISRSLAALEGTATPARSTKSSESAKRPSPRRAQSVEVGRDDISLPNVVEDSGESSRPLTPNLAVPLSPKDGGKPIVRRRSTNGKVYVPKRSASPALESPPIPFPASQEGPSPQSSLIRSARSPLSPTGSEPSPVRPSRQVRALSEVNVREPVGFGAMPTPKRHESMTPESRARAPARGSVSSSAISGTAVRQTLVFEEPGKLSVSYQLGNCIGRGQFGSVYRALNLSNGQMVAIKRIRLEGLKEEEVTDVMREVDLLQSLAHPSIVKYEGMSRDVDYLNIVMEYVENGSLGQTLKAFGKFNERLAASYATKILEGLHYLHSQEVVHCDLKAANILSTKNGNIKLSDFGVSLNMKAVENIKNDAETFSRTGKPVPVKDVAGTPHWMAPEVIQLAGALPVSDIWSLGCTIIELLTGKPPYADILNSMTVLFRIVEDDLPPLPPDISDDVSDFLRQCFIKDPKHRPSAVMLFEHPWLKRGWGQEIALRPQDSIPFLRRVSQDLQRVDSSRVFSSEGSSPYEGLRRGASARDLVTSAASSSANVSTAATDAASAQRIVLSHGPAKTHRLLKTTFSKAIICRLCSQPAKRSCVLCQDCGLICHAACATSYPSKCDQLAQLLAYAQQSGQYDLGELALSRPEIGPQSLPVTSELLSTSPGQFQQKLMKAMVRKGPKIVPPPGGPRQSQDDVSQGSAPRSIASRLSMASSSESGSAAQVIEPVVKAPCPTKSVRSVNPVQRHRKSESKDCTIM